MSHLEGTTCLERMCDLIGASEDWLVQTVIASARELGAAGHAPRSMASWRDSVRGLSDALFQAVYAVGDGYAEGPAHGDPVVAYGIVRARSQIGRGMRPELWLDLLQHYRVSYLALIRSSEMDGDDQEVCCRFVDRVFDRFEGGFRDEVRILDHGRAPHRRSRLAE